MHRYLTLALVLAVAAGAYAAVPRVTAEADYFKLAFDIALPLPRGEAVELTPTAMAEQGWWGQRQERNALLESAGDFVNPRDLQLRNSAHGPELLVCFRFKGPKDTTRRVRVTLTLADADGAAVAEMTRDCTDARSAPRKCKCIETEEDRGYRINREAFGVALEQLAQAHSLRVVFEEI